MANVKTPLMTYDPSQHQAQSVRLIALESGAGTTDFGPGTSLSAVSTVALIWLSVPLPKWTHDFWVKIVGRVLWLGSKLMLVVQDPLAKPEPMSASDQPDED